MEEQGGQLFMKMKELKFIELCGVEFFKTINSQKSYNKDNCLC